MTVREEWLDGSRYIGPRKTHPGNCCYSCEEDLRGAFADYEDTSCCCLEIESPDYIKTVNDRMATAWEAYRRWERANVAPTVYSGIQS